MDLQHHLFWKESWVGDSSDGTIVDGTGYHAFRMNKEGFILEAFEFYETQDEKAKMCAKPISDHNGLHFQKDLGFEDFEGLEPLGEEDFYKIKKIALGEN